MSPKDQESPIVCTEGLGRDSQGQLEGAGWRDLCYDRALRPIRLPCIWRESQKWRVRLGRDNRPEEKPCSALHRTEWVKTESLRIPVTASPPHLLRSGPILALSQARTKADLQLGGTCSGKVPVLGCRVWSSHPRCSALIRLGSWRSIKLFFHPDVLIKGRLKVSRQLSLPQSQPPSSNWSVMASVAQRLLSWCPQPS